jgi:hypothetical protein
MKEEKTQGIDTETTAKVGQTPVKKQKKQNYLTLRQVTTNNQPSSMAYLIQSVLMQPIQKIETYQIKHVKLLSLIYILFS